MLSPVIQQHSNGKRYHQSANAIGADVSCKQEVIKTEQSSLCIVLEHCNDTGALLTIISLQVETAVFEYT